MSERLPEWTRRATQATDAEVSGVGPELPEPLRVAGERATSASDVEVQRLVARLEAGPVRVNGPSLGWQWMPIAGAIAAVAVVGVLLWSPGPTAPAVPEVAQITVLQAGQSRQLSGAATLGPSIEVVGVAQLEIGTQPGEGHVVLLREGSTRWSVDPQGADRALTVRAGEVDVSVVGTVFEVMRLGGLVVVEVEEGKVRVEGPEGASFLTAGGRIELPDHRVAVVTPSADADADADTDAVAEAPLVPDDGAAAEVDATPSSDPAEATNAWTGILDRIDAGEDAHELVAAMDGFLVVHGSSVFADEARYQRLLAKSQVEAAWLLAPEVSAAAQAYPEGRRVLDLWMLHATLARDGMQDCTTALPSYRIVATDGTGMQQAEAEAWRGLCAARVGFDPEAAAALARAIQLGVQGELATEVQEALDRLMAQ